jgi:hypothetical protein
MNENMTIKTTPEQEEKLQIVRESITLLFKMHNLSLNEGLSVMLQICAIGVATCSDEPDLYIEILKKYLSTFYKEVKEKLKNE